MPLRIMMPGLPPPVFITAPVISSRFPGSSETPAAAAQSAVVLTWLRLTFLPLTRTWYGPAATTRQTASSPSNTAAAVARPDQRLESVEDAAAFIAVLIVEAFLSTPNLLCAWTITC